MFAEEEWMEGKKAGLRALFLEMKYSLFCELGLMRTSVGNLVSQGHLRFIPALKCGDLTIQMIYTCRGTRYKAGAVT